MDEIRLNSKRAYPRREYKDEYASTVESLGNKKLRIVLKLIMCSGFRIGEVLNCYLYRDEEGRIIIRAVAEKRFKITKFKMFKRAFLGEKFLNAQIRRDAPIFKSRPILNLFNLDIKEIEDLVSSDRLKPEWLGVELPSYKQLYALVKHNFSAYVSYRGSKLEIPIKTDFSPSFHFFRKLFSAEHEVKGGRASKTVAYLGWENPNMLFQYVKEYDEDTDEALGVL